MIKVKARFIALPPGALERREMEIEIAKGTTVGDLISMLASDYPVLGYHTRFINASVNGAYVGMQTQLSDGDEIVYSPPVGGGQ